MQQQYKHIVPANDAGLICNHNLFDIFFDGNADLLAGILSSSFVILSKYQFGRPVGVEGNLKTEVIDTKMMLVPDPGAGSAASRKKVIAAFQPLKAREAKQLLSERRMRHMAKAKRGKHDELAEFSDVSELEMADRHALDDAVLEMMGVASQSERKQIRTRLYEHLEEMFDAARRKEERGIENKNKSRRKSGISVGELASQIVREIVESNPTLVRTYEDDFLRRDLPHDTYEVPEKGEPVVDRNDMFTPTGIRFCLGQGKKRRTVSHIETRSIEQANLLKTLTSADVRGLVRVPADRSDAESVNRRFADFVETRRRAVAEAVREKVPDEDIQADVERAALHLLQQHPPH
jgi:hypothetical protein